MMLLPMELGRTTGGAAGGWAMVEGKQDDRRHVTIDRIVKNQDNSSFAYVVGRIVLPR